MPKPQGTCTLGLIGVPDTTALEATFNSGTGESVSAPLEMHPGTPTLSQRVWTLQMYLCVFLSGIRQGSRETTKILSNKCESLFLLFCFACFPHKSIYFSRPEGHRYQAR